ncbi:MAG: universal stress protein [Proteobacteria bacterium]|jgi:universal stress protein A|nr:universal stress protein [Pseudomonadota bacterium]
MSDKILVAVDFSEPTVRTLQYAANLAKGRGVKVDLLYVILNHIPAHIRIHAPAEILDKIMRAEHLRAQSELDELLDQYVPEAHRGKAILKEGLPAEAICEVSMDGYDMVVVATHGRTGLTHILIGSVAERVVRYAKVPVLVVR